MDDQKTGRQLPKVLLFTSTWQIEPHKPTKNCFSNSSATLTFYINIAHFVGEHLRDDVKIWDQSALKYDGDVGSVEKFDGVRRILASVSGGFDGQIHAESLKVDDDDEHQNRGQEVHQVRKVLTVEGFSETPYFVRPRRQKVEQGDDRSLEFGSWLGGSRKRLKKYLNEEWTQKQCIMLIKLVKEWSHTWMKDGVQ